MRWRTAALLVALLVADVGFPASVGAHAKLVRADPAPGSVVAAAPRTLRLRFSQELRVQGSIVNVRDGRNVVVASGSVDLNDLERKVMIAALPRLAPGTFTVRWQAVSAEDGDVTRGSFQFTVRS